MEEEVVQCQYLPLSSLQKAMELFHGPSKNKEDRCKRNLLHLQTNRSLYYSEGKTKKWRNIYQIAIRNAIYSHNWDRLLYLLKKSPTWEHELDHHDHFPVYLRAFTILLMNHPSAKVQLLLNDYMHLVLSLRSDQDKKAVYKTLLSLQQKIYGR